MFKQIKLSLKNKIVFVNIVIVVLFAGSLVFLINMLVTSTLIETKRESVKEVIEGQSRELQFALSRPTKAVRELSKHETIVNSFDEKTLVKEQEINEILRIFMLGREYSNVYLMDKNGDVVNSLDPSFLNNNFAFRDYFKYAIEGKPHVQIAFGVLTQKPGYYVSAPVIQENNGVVGVVVIKLEVAYIGDILKDSLTKVNGHYFLTDENGVVIHSDKDIEAYQSMGKIPDIRRDKLVEERRFEGFGLKPLQYQVVQDVIDSYKEPVIFNYDDEEDGEEELLQVYRVGEYPFYLVSETAQETLYSQIDNILWPIMTLMFSAVSVGIFIQYLFFGRLLKPLSKLEQYTRDVAGGSLDQTIDIKTGDELQSLAESVQLMIVAISKSKEMLEVKVVERTTELEKVKNSLEEKVKERTEELEMLKAELEEKVKERTNELITKLAQLEKLQDLIIGREQKMIELKKEIQHSKGTTEENI